MRLRHAFLALLMVLSLTSFIEAQESNEEYTVRETYAKMSFATRLEKLYRLDSQREAKTPKFRVLVEKAGIDFTIHTLTHGNLADIYSDPISNFIDLHMGDVLNAGGSGFERSENGGIPLQIHLVRVNGWDFSDYQPPPEYWQISVQQGLALFGEKGVVYTSYAAYTVTASYGEKSRTYKGMFLFGHGVDGHAKISPLDSVIDVSLMIDNDIFPAAFFQTHMATPEALNVLEAYRSDSCESGKVCCDHFTLKCNVSGIDLDAAAARNQRPAKRPVMPNSTKP